MNKRLIGSEREEQAAAFLRARGMEILVHSFRCRLGEIDLVARDGDTLVFVEVKYRYSGYRQHRSQQDNQRTGR